MKIDRFFLNLRFKDFVMNVLRGEIIDIVTEHHLSLVNVKVGDVLLTSIVIDTPPYVKKTNFIKLLFKETEVIIAREGTLAISVQNRIPCTVEKIKKGKLLCELALTSGPHRLSSVITARACDQLQLREGDRVLALIKTNEISLSADD